MSRSVEAQYRLAGTVFDLSSEAVRMGLCPMEVAWAARVAGIAERMGVGRPSHGAVLTRAEVEELAREIRICRERDIWGLYDGPPVEESDLTMP